MSLSVVVAVVSASCVGAASTNSPTTHSAATRPEVGVTGPSKCPGPAQGTPPHLSLVSGRASTHPVISGMVAHGPGEGGQPVPPTTRVEVWWNLSPLHWPTALGDAPWPSRPAAPVNRIAEQHVTTGCRYSIRLSIPAAIPGPYRVAVLASNATSTTIQGATTFTVTAPQRASLSLTTDSGVAVRFPASWCGQVQNGVNAAISSYPVHAPALAERENPPTGALVYIYDAPPSRLAALDKPRRAPGHLRLAHFQPNYEGIGAAYRTEIHDRGHDILIFISLGDAATHQTRREAVTILNTIHVQPSVSREWVQSRDKM
jgi:hypothetical protein